jgi:uncharacterized RDD family membrane protein YckC
METLHLSAVTSGGETIHSDFWSRALAKIIDGIALSIFLLPFDLAFGTSFVLGRGGADHSAAGQVVVLALFCFYSAAMESSQRQATLGKLALGIIVTDLDGARISFYRALLRSASQVTGIGYILALFTARKQTLHDFVADTQVLPARFKNSDNF